MDITPYVESLRRDLVAAAEAGGDDIRSAADRLVAALEPAARLALMEAVSQAASEITAEMPAGSVDVRLNGRELGFVLDLPAPAPPPPPNPAPAAEETEEDGAIARITLRLPESVKSRAEELAARSGHSLNTWLVNVVRGATTADQSINVDIDLSSIPFLGGDPFGRGGRRGNRMTGWV
ncbi:pilus assembly protein HicB [Nocardioides donggukensis]|uniref:Pilus assembly protein HicB n=1 Tax=Nocardioides donggukensis TaxID=2774019 RepID=A0A927Q0A1_9ACTN|nr:pilus assembly protein HicB [Nocardioides donggukensis]MBD8868199.1 pilus assembly protein HicB [Nocardioides donggukensis]